MSASAPDDDGKVAVTIRLDPRTISIIDRYVAGFLAQLGQENAREITEGITGTPREMATTAFVLGYISDHQEVIADTAGVASL